MLCSISRIGLAITISSSCNDKKIAEDLNIYTFTKAYYENISVGGVVGIVEKCYEINDIVTAESITNSSIIIRIAVHTELNDSKGPWNYQELLEIPFEYVNRK